jgi:hypothetical protein
MDKSPVFKANVEAGEVPVGAVGKFVSGEGTRDFALIS